MNVSIKKIRGKKYVYLEDYAKVNGKSKKISIYLGKYPINPNNVSTMFQEKLLELELKKMKYSLDMSLEGFRPRYLTDLELHMLETLKFAYKRFKDLYPEEAQRYEDVIYVKYTQGSTAIEGNTLTLQETNLLMNEGITPKGKSLREVYEVVNFKELRKFIREYHGDITENLIKKIHSILMANILDTPGGYRRTGVLIEGAEHEPPPAFEVPELMKTLVKWYKSNKKKLYPLELVCEFHARFEAIHPFPDGNGRVGRALLNFVFERRGYPTVYLNLEQREDYLDSLVAGDRDDYKPLVSLIYKVTTGTHQKLAEDFKPVKDEKASQKYSKLIKKACGL